MTPKPIQSRRLTLVVWCSVSLFVAIRVGLFVYRLHHSERVQPAALETLAQPSDRVLQFLHRSDAAAPKSDGQFPCVFADVIGTAVHPQIGKCGLSIDQHGPIDRFETDLRYGTFVVKQSDFDLGGAIEVPLVRTYNSRDLIQPNSNHAFGIQTNHSYDLNPLGSRFPYTFQMLALADENFIYFDRVSEGTGYADAIFQHTETSTSFYKAVTAWNGNGWTTWKTDGTTILFPESYNATNAAQGAFFWMRDAQGNILQLKRDAMRNLQEILTPQNHWIRFQYDNRSRIVGAQDDSGHSARYSYNKDGMLTDAVFSSGRARYYSYDGNLITAVKDEAGQTLVQNTYLLTRLVRQDFGHGQEFKYRYRDSGTGELYAETVNITRPGGQTLSLETGNSVPEFVTLMSALNVLREVLNDVGVVRFVAHTHDKSTGNNWTTKYAAESSDVNPSLDKCSVSYHYKVQNGANIAQDSNVEIPLDRVEKVIVMPEETYLMGIASASEHASLKSTVDPFVFVLKATRINSDDYNVLAFPNPELANRAANAMKLAADLCRSRNPKFVSTGSPTISK